jgi:Fe-S cluster assembly scaffold protein SufB
MGQFERTLIIVDEGASVHYVEGCTAPIYSSDSLHSAVVVEIIVKPGAHCRPCSTRPTPSGRGKYSSRPAITAAADPPQHP